MAVFPNVRIAVTNYHVVKNLNGSALGAMTTDGRVVAVAEILAADVENDVALIKLKGENFKPLSLVTDAATGSEISIISHPSKRFYAMTDGIISRYFYKYINDNKYPRMEVTADFAKGSSGAPVFNAAGNVVGIITSTQSIYYNKKNGHKENLQMVVHTCIPASAIQALTKQP